ncbi:DUF4387 domain-containing protein [Amycolatopsis endophytica]|uniref:DUF4387 domain-containing protein n=1 Tax=Amycolatopsis endophytica TaxID=860233 RepID=A0A853B250_9PSEU|nr:DUF4387 domain-containing protein [Amycolatopsis endophytica]NYI88897.1 hypothetical protein [Amycolatopsis endophytica]
MSTLREVATHIRAKNAGPFWLTVDVFLPDRLAFDRVVASGLTDPVVVGRTYEVDPASVRVFPIPDLNVVKVSFPRPTTQGSRDDRDMHGGQQFVPLLDLPV